MSSSLSGCRLACWGKLILIGLWICDVDVGVGDGSGMSELQPSVKDHEVEYERGLNKICYDWHSFRKV